MPLGHWPWHRVLMILLNGLGSDLKKTTFYNPRFTGIHSSPKERQLQKCCISFQNDCNEVQSPEFDPNHGIVHGIFHLWSLSEILAFIFVKWKTIPWEFWNFDLILEFSDQAINVIDENVTDKNLVFCYSLTLITWDSIPTHVMTQEVLAVYTLFKKKHNFFMCVF